MLNILVKPHRSYLMAKTEEPQKLFVMLRLVPERKVSQTRPTVALALVIDTSGSMREKTNGVVKLDRAIEAAHKLIDSPQLQPTDKLTIIQFEDESRVLLPLSTLDKKKAHQVVETLHQYEGGTQMGKGMRNALSELGRESPESARRTILLTDGLTFDEEYCRQLVQKFAEENIPIASFGIGDEYNQDLLLELANATKGYTKHLVNMQELEQLFAQDLSQVIREVITDLQMKVGTVKGINLDRISRIFPMIAEISLASQPFRLGNIPAGDYTIFIVELTVSGIARPPSRVRLAQLSLWGNVPGLKIKHHEFPPQEIIVEFTTDATLTAQCDPEVLDYVQQKNINALIDRATRLAGQGKQEEARQTLRIAANQTQQLNNPRVTKLIQSAIDELDRTGTISPDTTRTLRADGRTVTVKSKHTEIYRGDQ